MSFEIRVPEAEEGQIGSTMSRRLNELNQNPNELNTQVFSVLFFNTFVDESGGGGGDSFATSAEAAAFSSLRNFTTTQLNKFADKWIKGVEISFDMDSYSSGNQGTGSSSVVTEMGVKVSKSLFDDRLSIIVGSNVNMKRDGAFAFDSADFAGVAGDFVLEYKLTPEGNYIVKVYHINDYDVLLEGTDYKTGVSFGIRKVLRKKDKDDPEATSKKKKKKKNN